jgi:hypothetical protein
MMTSLITDDPSRVPCELQKACLVLPSSTHLAHSQWDASRLHAGLRESSTDRSSVVLQLARALGFFAYSHCEQNAQALVAQRTKERQRRWAGSRSITHARSQEVGVPFGRTLACEYTLPALRARRSTRPQMIRAPVLAQPWQSAVPKEITSSLF